MPQETVGYTSLEWICKRCGSKNLGTARICSNCGSPMAEKDKFDLPAQQQLITDNDELLKAQHGPDIQCKSCGTRNPTDAKMCSQCGSDLAAAPKRQAGNVLGGFSTAAAPDVKCPSCGEMNPASALNCKNCGSSLAQRKPDTAQPRLAAPAAKGGKLIALGLLAAAVVLFLLLTRTTETSASVQAVEWQRTIGLLEQRPVSHETWQDQIPASAPIGTCLQKVRTTQDNPAPNADKICGTPYTIDQGNGTGKVVQDCKYEVKDNWCAYTQQEWAVVNALAAHGGDRNPAWPTLNLNLGQREGDHTEAYTVTLATETKQYYYYPTTAVDFTQYTIGSRWTLKVNGLGAVLSLTRTK